VKTKKVVAYENLPARLPIWISLTAWLLLDRFKPPGWVWGVVGTIFAFLWIVSIVDACREERIKLKELL
jgi:hypothetical protein